MQHKAMDSQECSHLYPLITSNTKLMNYKVSYSPNYCTLTKEPREEAARESTICLLVLLLAFLECANKWKYCC